MVWDLETMRRMNAEAESAYFEKVKSEADMQIAGERILRSESGCAVAVSRPVPLCRWWLRTRDCKNAIRLGPSGSDFEPVKEFYVPWWAWPLELIHRILFGSPKLMDQGKERQ